MSWNGGGIAFVSIMAAVMGAAAGHTWWSERRRPEDPEGASPPATAADLIPGHIERQRAQGPPFYCGTAFCGHHTMKAAAECWNIHAASVRRLQAEEAAAIQARDATSLQRIRAEQDRLYPQNDPRNYPVNRSRAELVREYTDRAAREERSR
jgi:hypothetical protein